MNTATSTGAALDAAMRDGAGGVTLALAGVLLLGSVFVLLRAAGTRSSAPEISRGLLLALARMWAGAIAAGLAFGIIVVSYGATLTERPVRVSFLQAYTDGSALLPGWFVALAVAASVVCGVMIWHLLNSTLRRRPEADAAA